MEHNNIRISNVRGDIIGGIVSGTGNIIGKNIKIENTNNKKITINEQVLKELDPLYSKTFQDIIKSLNVQIEAKKVDSQQIQNIQKSLEVLAKESTDLSPDKKPDELKKRRWKEKFKIFAKHAIKALPKTAATLAMFIPLTSSFSKTIEEGLQHVVEGMQEAMK